VRNIAHYSVLCTRPVIFVCLRVCVHAYMRVQMMGVIYIYIILISYIQNSRYSEAIFINMASEMRWSFNGIMKHDHYIPGLMKSKAT